MSTRVLLLLNGKDLWAKHSHLLMLWEHYVLLENVVQSIDCLGNEHMNYQSGQGIINDINYILLGDFPNSPAGLYWRNYFIHQIDQVTLQNNEN